MLQEARQTAIQASEEKKVNAEESQLLADLKLQMEEPKLMSAEAAA